MYNTFVLLLKLLYQEMLINTYEYIWLVFFNQLGRSHKTAGFIERVKNSVEFDKISIEVCISRKFKKSATLRMVKVTVTVRIN